MKCSKLRRLLADGGPAALAGNQKAEDHLVDCAECYAVLEAMAEVDRLLPELESHDVSDEVVERLLARPELTNQPGASAPKTADRLARLQPLRWLAGAIDRARQTRLRWGLVAVPAVLVVGLVSMTTIMTSDFSEVPQKPYVVKQVKFKQPPTETEEQTNQEEVDGKERLSNQAIGRLNITGADEAGAGREIGQQKNRAMDPAPLPSPRARPITIPRSTRDTPEAIRDYDAEETVDFVPDTNLLVLGVPDAPPPPEPPLVAYPFSDQDGWDDGKESAAGAFANETETASDTLVGDDKDDLLSRDGRLESKKQPRSQNRAAAREIEEYRRKLKDLEAQSAALRDLGDIENADLLDAQLRQLKKPLEDVDVIGGKMDTSSVSPSGLSLPVSGNDNALTAAETYLANRERIDGLTFREARGYWANTYVPGDRTLRRLKARLDRAAETGSAGALHEGSRQITQPFDPPDGAALAVYLHGDRRGVEGRERMLVQVGLKGTLRRSGTRPAMNVGLVLDLRGDIEPAESTSIRALLAAFSASAELGDHFSLTVAGRPGGTILPPGDLRHGPLTVAMTQLFSGEAEGSVLSLDEAAAAALATVRADDDPNAPFGSSALIVITAHRLGDVTGRLTAMAHQSAVEGVPWSVIGIGEGVDLAQLDTLVLAGQGNRRLLTSAAEAEALVDRELAAVSRVVARAVRLRIRLAPGVQLVDVIGSERLGERRTQQVRDAEQATDQRLSRNLGIQADRGLDEEGIQIVIPSFYADNAHVVLLDVVVPGPGPVADVTVRYKDLVHMKNGVARTHLRVGRAESPVGPLEINVLANLVATEVASSLDRAADAAEAGDLSLARTTLEDILDLVVGITRLVEGLEPDFANDIEMLDGFIQALEGLPAKDTARVRMISDSLRYAGRLKILPPPVENDESTP